MLHVEVEYHACKNETHFDQGQATLELAFIVLKDSIEKEGNNNENHYFCPIQSLDPVKKGLKASRASFANAGSPMKRSGWKASGSVHNVGARYKAHGQIPTTVFQISYSNQEVPRPREIN